MTPEQFLEKWSGATLSERAASHEHFLDLWHLLDQPDSPTVLLMGSKA